MRKGSGGDRRGGILAANIQGNPEQPPAPICGTARLSIYGVPGMSENPVLEITRKKIEVFLAPGDFRSEKSQIQDTD